MAKIEHLETILKKEGLNFTKILLKNTIYIAEKLDGISFNVKKTEEGFVYFKKNMNKPISVLDRTIISLYEKPILLFSTLSENIVNSIPNGYVFTFEYFPNHNPVNIKYDYIPKNNLVLTNVINSLNNESAINLQNWAKLFNTEWSEFLNRDWGSEQVLLKSFSNKQISEIIDMIGTDNIKTKIYELFPYPNGKDRNTLHSDTTKMIEGFVFYTGDKKYPFFKLITREYYDAFIKKRDNKIKDRKSNDIVNLVILDFINYYTNSDNSDIIDLFTPLNEDKDKLYIELISYLFVGYIENNNRWVGTKFPKPRFADSEFFDLNLKFIENSRAIKFINESQTNKDIFKILLSYFRKSSINKGGLIDDNKIKIIAAFKNVINNKLNLPKAINFNSNNIELTKFENNINEENKEYYTPISSLFLMEILQDRYGVKLTKEDLQPVPNSVGTGIGSYNVGGVGSPVNIFPGKFQPFHNGHLKVIKKMYDKNKKPSVLVVITPDDKEHSFNQEMHMKVFKDLLKNNDMIKDVIFAKRGWIKDIMSKVRPKYEPVLWGYGDDRKNNYETQIADWSKELKTNIKGHFVSREDDKLSSTQVRSKILKGEDISKILPKDIIKNLSVIKNLIK